MIGRRTGIAPALAAIVLAMPMTVGAASAPGMRDAGICIPLIYCPQPTPTPTPTAPSTPTSPVLPSLPPVPTLPTTPSVPTKPSDPLVPVVPADPTQPNPTPTPTAPVDAPIDPSAPMFTGTPASMGSSSLSFSGLKGISIVSVPIAGGGSIRALKISADEITIKGFSLTVRPPDGPGLVTTADTISLQGNVSVYVGSITASAMDGSPVTIGTDTPPPLTDVKPGLLNVSMGLVGSVADLITYSNTDQQIVEVNVARTAVGEPRRRPSVSGLRP